jgi:hypothetical protein
MISPLRLGFLVGVTIVAASANSMPELVQKLDTVMSEDEARTLVEPHLGELRKLDAAVMEKIVLRQWWELAREIVTKSHAQQVDLSFAVRKSVRTLKDEADELLRTLNPKYGQAQQVTPAFQWAQNDSCIFLSVKYTVRWNAPGALEVTEPSVNISLNNFSFSGLGKHSNNKYRYFLALSLFDNTVPEASIWSAASVGRLSVTMRKKWARKWPRLLADKKLKIGNMHLWSERQEALDGSLSGMSSVSNSPVTCAASQKMYCLPTDTCKKAGNCSLCPGKGTSNEEAHLCAGAPSEKASLTFKDVDMDSSEISGEVKIHKARNEFDIDRYVVYYGKDDSTKLQADPLGSSPPTGGDAEVRIPLNTALPAEATHLLVFSENAYGEYGSPGSTLISDAVLPKERPVSIAFEDEDGDVGHVSGTVAIEQPADTTNLDEYALHWGKSPNRKIATSSQIHVVSKSTKDAAGKATHYLSKGTKIPEGATHMIAYSKNSHGENPNGVALKIMDAKKPCFNKTDNNCPRGVTAEKNADGTIKLSVMRAKDERGVQKYAFYWGRRDCADGGQQGAKNGHIQDLNIDTGMSGDTGDVSLAADTVVPPGTTHVLAFSKNAVGEANNCVSTSFESGDEKKEL